MRKQLFQPLTLLDIEWDMRPMVQLQKLKYVGLCYPYSSVPFDASKLSITLFLAEFLYYALRREQQNVLLFDYIADSLKWLDGCGDSFANFHLVFMIRLSRFIGFFPNTEGYCKGDFFDMRAATFSSVAPIHSEFLRPEDAGRINTLMRMNYDTMHLFRMSRNERNRIVDVLVAYYRIHVPDFPELRSLQVMKELWN